MNLALDNQIEQPSLNSRYVLQPCVIRYHCFESSLNIQESAFHNLTGCRRSARIELICTSNLNRKIFPYMNSTISQLRTITRLSPLQISSIRADLLNFDSYTVVSQNIHKLHSSVLLIEVETLAI